MANCEEIRLNTNQCTNLSLYLLSLAEENGHDESIWKADPRAVNEPVSGAFYKGKVLGILGVFDDALYGRQRRRSGHGQGGSTEPTHVNLV